MDEPDRIMVKLVVYALGIVIAIFATRAIFGIGTIIRNMKAQTTLLRQIAEKQGVTKEEIKAALSFLY